MRRFAIALLLFVACTTTKPVELPPSLPTPPAPIISAETRALFEKNLAEARANYEKAPNDADAIIWLGRRTAYLGNYAQAIEIFTEGARKHPRDARMLRHRGHRWITLRQFDRAIADLTKAANLERGKPDTIEPDGLPNARNIPLTTLQSNVWYTSRSRITCAAISRRRCRRGGPVWSCRRIRTASSPHRTGST